MDSNILCQCYACQQIAKQNNLRSINVYDNPVNPFINAARGRDESGINEDELKQQ